MHGWDIVPSLVNISIYSCNIFSIFGNISLYGHVSQLVEIWISVFLIIRIFLLIVQLEERCENYSFLINSLLTLHPIKRMT